MKALGVLGGMSWESTAVVYRLLNQRVAARLGGLHSAPLLLASVDFADIAALQRAGRWDEAGQRLGAHAAGLARAGAGALMIASNTMHKVADAVAAACGLPLLHIADATGDAVRAAGLHRLGLVGTRYTMEDPSCVSGRLRLRHGLEVLVPEADDRGTLNTLIFDELCRGIVRDASRDALLAVIDRLAARGAEGVILGCTELMLLVDPAADHGLPVFDSTTLHVDAAVRWMLEPSSVPADANPGTR